MFCLPKTAWASDLEDIYNLFAVSAVISPYKKKHSLALILLPKGEFHGRGPASSPGYVR